MLHGTDTLTSKTMWCKADLTWTDKSFGSKDIFGSISIIEHNDYSAYDCDRELVLFSCAFPQGVGESVLFLNLCDINYFH